MTVNVTITSLCFFLPTAVASQVLLTLRSLISNFCLSSSKRIPKSLFSFQPFQFSSVAHSCLILRDPMDCNSQGLSIFHHLPEIAQTHIHWVSDAIQPSCPLYPLLFLSSIFPSIRVFSNESVLQIRWPKYWSFSFSISPSSDYSGLISFRMDWLDLLAVQWTLKSVLQHHSSKEASHLVHYFVFTFSALGSNFWIRKHLQKKNLAQCEVQQCILFLLSSLGQASFSFLGNFQMISKKSIFLCFIQPCSWWTVCLI